MCRSERITLTATESFTLSFCLVCRARGSFDRRDHARQEWKLCQTLREAPGKQAFKPLPVFPTATAAFNGSIVDQLLFFFFDIFFRLPLFPPPPSKIEFLSTRGNFADLLSRYSILPLFFFFFFFCVTFDPIVQFCHWNMFLKIMEQSFNNVQSNLISLIVLILLR